MNKSKVLKQAKIILAVNPQLDGMELAQVIAGGHSGQHWPLYNKVALLIKDLKREGKL